VVLSTGAGCSIHTQQTVWRSWGGFNTAEEPQFVVEKFHHLPYKANRVRLMRWMYNDWYESSDVTYESVTTVDHTNVNQEQALPQVPALPTDETETGGSSSESTETNLPPAPPSVEQPLEILVPDGPTASRNSTIQRLSHSTAGKKSATSKSQPARDSRPRGTWLFSPR